MAQREVAPEEVVKAKQESHKMQNLAGFIWGRVFDDGRCLYLAASPVNRGKIFLGLSRNIDAKGYYAVWEYEPGEAVWLAAIGWDGHGEPVGYQRRVLAPALPN